MSGMTEKKSGATFESVFGEAPRFHVSAPGRVNLIGDHATWHLPYDAPLTSDILSLARPVSGFVRECQKAEELSADLDDALVAATQGPGQIATLIIPVDCQWDSAGPVGPIPPARTASSPALDTRPIEEIARALRGADKPVLYLGGFAGHRETFRWS